MAASLSVQLIPTFFAYLKGLNGTGMGTLGGGMVAGKLCLLSPGSI